jgi:hypothetical protein
VNVPKGSGNRDCSWVKIEPMIPLLRPFISRLLLDQKLWYQLLAKQGTCRPTEAMFPKGVALRLNPITISVKNSCTKTVYGLFPALAS